MRRKFSQKLILFLLILLFIFFIWKIVLRILEDYKHYRLLKSEANQLQERLSILEEEIAELKRQKEQSVQEEELEREVRLKMGMKKKGERVMMLVPPTTVNSTSSETVISSKPVSLLEKLRIIWYNFLDSIQRIKRE